MPPQAPVRRSFLRLGLLGLSGLLGAGAMVVWPVVTRAAPLLRPPGARPERLFLGSCIKCGLCLRACPVHAIRLGDANLGLSMGTPYLDAREQACGLFCDQRTCVRACPTGALEKQVVKLPLSHSRMGFAVLTDPERCLAFRQHPFKGLARGSRFSGVVRQRRSAGWEVRPLAQHPYDLEIPCDLCVRECPLPQAIRMEHPKDAQGFDGAALLPTVSKNCLGCGVCEMVCPTEPSSIRVQPRKQPPATAGI
ncbi:MAG: 4Fe-4S dicluster domain-containing protein [Magnetococcales bacterium]|nr:4Fe-4S dicluster domain-containing protein [Magnetococcales bacterium]